MKQYCISKQNELLNKIEESRNPFNKQFRKNKTSLSSVKECLTEYSLEDKVEALKTMLIHNEKHRQDLLSHRSIMPETKNIVGIIQNINCIYSYKEPFNSNLLFGKSRYSNINGTRIKRLLTWIDSDPTTVVNYILADFIERSRFHIGKVRNLKNAQLYMSMTHGKASGRKGTHEVANVLSDCSMNNDVIQQQKYLQYINSLRQKLKKRIPEIPFLDIYEDLLCLDKNSTGILPEHNVISTLAKYKIYINEKLLILLLDLLQIRKDKNMNYKELLNLLNWKCHFPTLPKIEKIPLECQYYSTIYRDATENMETIDVTRIVSEDLKDKTSAYSLIFPDIFTRHGLSYIDLSKLRCKEEIRSIFENIGVQFPNNNFDLLWEEGVKKDGTDNLSVKTFRYLLDQHDLTINEIKQ
ncbi:uncharacterized protein LOC143143561 isoform X1 [Ptiloglossa arizonensis]|uniref:uncharacterized protein LOC143143561 isoform X1 n=1 Tax=Ptiloglossa arizonensis TaxID=3350558 RepID=UPI003F9FFB8B